MMVVCVWECWCVVPVLLNKLTFWKRRVIEIESQTSLDMYLHVILFYIRETQSRLSNNFKCFNNKYHTFKLICI